MEELKTIVKDFLSMYEDNIEVTTGDLFKMPDVINKISLYKNSIFKSGDSDFQGNKKFFYNIVNQAVINAKKNIDLDTKDIIIGATFPEFRINAMVYSEGFKNYSKDTGFGIRINTLIETLCTYGSVITKKDKTGFKVVDMNKIAIDPGVSNKDNSFDLQGNFAIEKVIMTYTELAEMRNKWETEKVDKVLKSFEEINKGNTTKTEIAVYEASMYLHNSYVEEGKAGYGYYRVFLTLDSEEESYNDENNKTEAEVSGQIMFVESIKKLLYKKLDYYTILGRNLGKGPIETLFPNQEKINKIKHDIGVSMNVSSKHLFQTPDELIEKNIMQDLLNGDIIKSKNGISPIANEERNLPAWNMELATWGENGRQITNTSEVMTGEALPSNQTLGGQQLSTIQAAKFFDLLREQVGLFIKENLVDYVFPIFEKTIKIEDIIELSTPEVVNELMERDVNRRINRKLVDTLLSAKNVSQLIIPTQQELDIMREREMGKIKKVEFAKIKKDFFDFKKKIDVTITGENLNLAKDIAGLQSILELAANPAITQNPQTAQVLNFLLEKVGINKKIFDPTKIQNIPTQEKAGPVKAQSKAVESITPGVESVTPKV